MGRRNRQFLDSRIELPVDRGEGEEVDGGWKTSRRIEDRQFGNFRRGVGTIIFTLLGYIATVFLLLSVTTSSPLVILHA